MNLNSLYELRSKFIIIGLTGRLGSGCTIVSNLLTNEKFEDCNFPVPEASVSTTNEERKYRIVYNFLKHNWIQYTLIRASDIITMYLLTKELTEIESFLENIYVEDKSKVNSIIKEIKVEFEDLSRDIKRMFTFEGQIDKSQIHDKALALKLFFDDKRIERFSKKLKEQFQLLNITKCSHPYQYFGDNLRKTGDPISQDAFNPSNCYVIAKFIHELIKIIRDKPEHKARIIIDSIRNSMEARYFKERYSAFYLFAVNTEERFRLERLNNNYNTKQLKALDQEYTKDLATEERFYKQDIQTCIQVADIYLHNPNEEVSEGEKHKTVKKHVLRYLALILQPGIITPTPGERCMQIAYTAKYNSGCISRQVGAVVTDDSFSLKSIGWNSTAEGQTPCLLRSVEDLVKNADQEAYSEYEKQDGYKKLVKKTFEVDPSRLDLLKGRNISFCFKDGQNCLDNNKNQVHTRSLHAEENAMLQIAKYGGEGLKNGYLFTTASPCELCSKKAYQLGIKKVFYIDPYPGISDKQILKSGLFKHQPQTQLFVGAVGRAYHQLFEPFMAYKDELKTLLGFDYKRSKNELYSEVDKAKYIEDLNKQKMQIEDELLRLSNKEQSPIGELS